MRSRNSIFSAMKVRTRFDVSPGASGVTQNSRT